MKIAQNLLKIPLRLMSKEGSANSLPGAATRDQLVAQMKAKQYIPLFNKKTIFTDEYFKEKGDHFKLEDSRLEEQPYANTITGYTEHEILVNDFSYPGPIVLTKNSVFMWELGDFNSIRSDHLKIIDLMNPPPSYVLISSGKTKKDLPKELTDVLDKYKIKIDCLDIFLASGTFNICIEQDIDVMGFFWLK